MSSYLRLKFRHVVILTKLNNVWWFSCSFFYFFSFLVLEPVGKDCGVGWQLCHVEIKVEREQFHLIQKKHIKYYFELKDLSLTLLDICDQMLSRLESSINLFFSVQGHRMNLVMKTLTVVSSIFIPLTFIAGVYGMNFVNIPELNWKFGYFAVWGIMLLIFVLMLFYFKKKKWF